MASNQPSTATDPEASPLLSTSEPRNGQDSTNDVENRYHDDANDTNDDNPDGANNDDETLADRRRRREKRIDLVATTASTVTALLTFAVAGLTGLLYLNAAPWRYTIYWPVRVSMDILLVWSALPSVVSSLNLFWLTKRGQFFVPWLNVIADIAVLFAIPFNSVRGLVASLMQSKVDGPCQLSSGDYDGHLKECLAFMHVMDVLLRITFCLGIVLSVIQIVLLVRHCIAAYRSKFWKNPLRVPAGQLSLELNIRILRQDEGNIRI